MAPKDMVVKTVVSGSDDTRHYADVDSTVSLGLSSSSMSVEDDDDDDFEMGRRRTMPQHEEGKGRENKNSKNCNLKRPTGPENHEADEVEMEEEEDDSTSSTMVEIISKTWSEAHWMFQVVSTIWSCFWTYALIHNGVNDASDAAATEDALIWDPQIAIMVVLVLTGVSCPLDLFAPVGVGVFAGAVPRSVVPTYAALAVLAVVSALVWRLVAYTKFLAGFGGRMGTTTFIAMNLTAVLFLIPFGYMQDGWNAYGQPNWGSGSRDSDENDDNESMGFVSFAWDQAIVLVCSTTFLSVAGASLRIRAPRQQQQAPVHPFLTPCALALACDLLVAATVPNHRLSSTAYVGFSVGSYVAMAALTNLPNNEVDFFLAGLVAGWMGVLIDPFFVDFGGKAGFTAFLGYTTYKYMIMPLSAQFWSTCHLRQPLLPAIIARQQHPMLPFPLAPVVP